MPTTSLPADLTEAGSSAAAASSLLMAPTVLLLLLLGPDGLLDLLFTQPLKTSAPATAALIATRTERRNTGWLPPVGFVDGRESKRRHCQSGLDRITAA